MEYREKQSNNTNFAACEQDEHRKEGTELFDLLRRHFMSCQAKLITNQWLWGGALRNNPNNAGEDRTLSYKSAVTQLIIAWGSKCSIDHNIKRLYKTFFTRGAFHLRR